jgi:hypothetical protein
MVYAEWAKLDRQSASGCAPTFLTSAGVDDAFHARQTVQFYDALFEARFRWSCTSMATAAMRVGSVQG